jgi:hypothetical protein
MVSFASRKLKNLNFKASTNYYMKKVFIAMIAIAAFAASVSAQTKSIKKGIAYGYHSESDMAADSKGLLWWYNWAVAPESRVANVFTNYNMDFVPMAWNGSFDETALRAFYASHPNARYLLGFNEPNFTTQANLTPRQAAALWPKLEAIAADYNLKIVGPAVNYCDKCITVNGTTISDPVQYLDSFFVACPNCKVDYIAVHNYMCYSGALKSYIDGFKKYGKKIWLTEFACWDQPAITLDMQKNYVLGALDYLENDTMVFRYSWFTGDRSGGYPYISLFQPQSGALTDLGNLYVTYNPVHDTSVYVDVPARIEAESYNAMYGVSIEGVKDVDGLADVGWIDPGDWLEYNINVPSSGTYYVFFRIASNASTNLELRENGATLDILQVPSSGGWQNWTTLKTAITLTQGKHKLQVYTNTGQFNLNWLTISDNANAIPTATSLIRQNEKVIYPNPVADKLYIQSDDQGQETKVSIIDQSGKLLLTKIFPAGSNVLLLDINSLISGLYFVQVKNQNDVHNYRFVKQ